MNKFLATFKLTFFSKVKAKSFIFTTLLIIAGMFLAFNFDKIIDLFDSEENKEVEIIADDEFKATFASILQTYDEELEVVDADGGTTIEITNTDPIEAEVKSEDELSSTDEQNIQLALNDTHQSYVLQNLNLSEEEVNEIYQEVPVQFLVSKEDSSGYEEGTDDEFNILNMVIFYFSVILMFIIILSYANQIAMEIANEKSSRVIEMIVSSIRPVQHLMAKISAIICVSVIQVLLISLGGLLAFYLSDSQALLDQFGLETNEQTVKLIVYCIIFVILGLALYLSIAAMLGSFISRMEDIQQGMMPLTFISMIGYMVALMGINFADHILVTVSSYVPFFTPFVMPLRLLVSSTGHGPILIGIAIMVVSIILVLLLAAYVYKRSVLSTESGIMKNIKRIRK